MLECQEALIAVASAVLDLWECVDVQRRQRSSLFNPAVLAGVHRGGEEEDLAAGL